MTSPLNDFLPAADSSLSYSSLTICQRICQRELYFDDPEEMKKNVDARIESLDKVDFIKNCFFFFAVHDSARRSTWKNIKNALNSRARKMRRSRDMESQENRDPYTTDFGDHYE
ncbi:hypothetical protein Q1695_012822 [Nippostrongylus brasiliensis]|nr:hypothetical protein Q1695_012822 [Nippostrongylus brasiliensis]